MTLREGIDLLDEWSTESLERLATSLAAEIDDLTDTFVAVKTELRSRSTQA